MTYNFAFEVPDDGLTRAIFAPGGVAFMEAETTRPVDISITLTNDETGDSYTTPPRTITVSRSRQFVLRYDTTDVRSPLSVYSPPTSLEEVAQLPGSMPLQPALGICQGSGSYDLIEFEPPGSPEDTYVPYTQAYLANRFMNVPRVQEFDGLSSEVLGFVQKPVLSPTLGFRSEDKGYGEVVVDPGPNNIGDIPWRLNTDSVTTAISGERTIEVQRFATVSGQPTPVGFVEVIVYQAPRIQVLNVAPRYCSSEEDGIDVEVRILRDGPGNEPIEGRLPASSDLPMVSPLLGEFNVYVTETEESDYSSIEPDTTVDLGSDGIDHFFLDEMGES